MLKRILWSSPDREWRMGGGRELLLPDRFNGDLLSGNLFDWLLYLSSDLKKKIDRLKCLPRTPCISRVSNCSRHETRRRPRCIYPQFVSSSISLDETRRQCGPVNPATVHAIILSKQPMYIQSHCGRHDITFWATLFSLDPLGGDRRVSLFCTGVNVPFIKDDSPVAMYEQKHRQTRERDRERGERMYTGMLRSFFRPSNVM